MHLLLWMHHLLLLVRVRLDLLLVLRIWRIVSLHYIVLVLFGALVRSRAAAEFSVDVDLIQVLVLVQDAGEDNIPKEEGKVEHGAYNVDNRLAPFGVVLPIVFALLPGDSASR